MTVGVAWLRCPMMSADLATDSKVTEELAFALETSPRNPAMQKIPGTLQLTVAVEAADVLAMLRTAVILARHFRLPLLVDIPEAVPGRTGNTNCGMQMHLGAAPCSAMLAALLDSVAQRLRTLNPGSSYHFLAEFGFSTELNGLLLRIHPAGASRRQSK